MLNQELIQKSCDSLQSEMIRLRIPGVALGILQGGETFSAGFGVTNLENPLPVDPDTLFQVGSITKTFTATALMRLIERGQADLDYPIRSIIPELRLADLAAEEKASLRHIFTHTGGWLGDYFDDAGPGDDALATVVARMDRLPQEAPLGEMFSYNNSGFYLAGRVLEILCGETYETAVKKLVLDPLGMDHSFFFAQDAITYRLAAGHSAIYPGQDGIPEVLRPWWLARAANPLGGLLSTVNDLLRYARLYTHSGNAPSDERLLQADSLTLMQTPFVPAANGESIGISWFLRDLNGSRVIRHGGATNGQMATLQIVPSADFALVILTNSDRGSELYHPLARRMLADFLGLIEAEPEPIAAERSALSPFAGIYESAAERLHLELKQDCLMMQVEPRGGFPTPDALPSPPPPPTRLALCAPDCLVGLDEPFKGDQVEILRGPQGELAWLRFGGRIHRKL